MKSYLILDNNKDIIIPLEWIENTFNSKMAKIIKPLGDTRSILNISMKWKHYKYLRDEFSKSWKRSLAVSIIDNDELILVNYYGSFISELTTTDNSEIVDLEIHSDYHEIHYENNGELKTLFKSWEREVRLNQLGI